jgi:large subunit ribosomal protein L6
VTASARESRDDKHAAVHGLTRALVFNAVQGVTKGWKKELDIVGIGYRAELKGKGTVVFTLGYSHPIEVPLPTGIEVAVDPKQTHLTITGIDRQKVGQVAADMRSLRKPDPVQEQGRALLGREAEEEGRQDGSEVRGSLGSEDSFQLKCSALLIKTELK